MSASPTAASPPHSDEPKEMVPDPIPTTDNDLTANLHNRPEDDRKFSPVADFKEESTEYEPKAAEFNSVNSQISPKGDENNYNFRSRVRASPDTSEEKRDTEKASEELNSKNSPGRTAGILPMVSPPKIVTPRHSNSVSGKPSPVLSPKSVKSVNDASRKLNFTPPMPHRSQGVGEVPQPIFEATETKNIIGHDSDRRKLKTKKRIRVDNSDDEGETVVGTARTDGELMLMKNNREEERRQHEEHKKRLKEGFINLVEKGVIPPLDINMEIQVLLHAAEMEALEKEDYDYGKKIEDSKRLLTAALEETASSNKSNEHLEFIRQRLEIAKNDYIKKNEYWNDVLMTFRNEQAMSRRRLKEKHDSEMAEFERKWSDMTNRSFFNKPSPTLLSMRKQQKILAMSKAWTDAKEVKARADNLQKIETQRAMARAISCMKQEHQNLIDKHRKEMECFNEHERKTSVFLHSERFSAMHPIEMSIRNLTNSLEKPPMNMKPTKNAIQSSMRTRMRTESVVAPRPPGTSRKFNQFRFRDTASKLDLVGIDVKKFIGKPSATIRVSRIMNE